MRAHRAGSRTGGSGCRRSGPREGASFVVVERGSAARGRDRLRSEDLVTGVGGAGLYSDGKFSFAPSATSLWRLEPREGLREAYDWTAGLLRSHGMDCPPFPEQVEVDGGEGVKRYPSQYMPLEERLAIVKSMEALAEDRIVTGVRRPPAGRRPPRRRSGARWFDDLRRRRGARLGPVRTPARDRRRRPDVPARRDRDARGTARRPFRARCRGARRSTGSEVGAALARRALRVADLLLLPARRGGRHALRRPRDGLGPRGRSADRALQLWAQRALPGPGRG